MNDKTKAIVGQAVVILLALCAAWNACAVAFALWLYLPSLTSKGFVPMDLMLEIDSLAVVFNYTLPIAILAVVIVAILARRHAVPLFAASIVMVIFVATLAPSIPLMNHFQRIHEGVNIWANHVWWIPGGH